MSTALYRRYRPETFAEVIGQEQVTQPLMTALEKNRVNHAYLFSGPRGCGKTTSARILARCLNCAQGPTPTPCGVCPSCKELARDGGGSLDVIEMDAASHGGVDHARDLRERATFAPVRDRYKIFIIDEAHMVTREGFNALLKIVEEPPEHIKFIFATTEPNKVLGTIRSRTHHYPFRLVPPEVLGNYLKQVCAQEQVEVADGVLPLVVRAGGGSVRDSLSILDQLIAGSAQGSISYDLAVALLGFTHAQLLDQVVDALAAEDSAALFASVDRVVQSGQDPRRFVEDLLERFRDLIIVRAVPESAGSILRDISADQLERLQTQAQRLGAAELSRAADISNETLNGMSGAMNPQLQLELLCARLLLASADQGLVGLAARLDRLEKRMAQGVSGPDPAAQSAQGLAAPPLAPAGQASQPLTAPPLAPASAPAGQQVASPLAAPPLASPPLAPPAPASQPPAPQEPVQQVSPPADPAGPGTLELVQTNWERVLAQLDNGHAKAQFALCQPVRYESGQLYLLAEMAVLKAVKNHLPLLQAALKQVLGLDVQLRGQVKRPGEGGGGVQHPAPGPQAPSPNAGPSEPQPGPAPEAPLAAGPRGDEAAWAAHGQPRSNQPPSWSQDDWNNPVTSWQVAPIPQDDQPPTPAAESQQAPTPEPAAPLASPPLSPVAASPAPVAPIQPESVQPLGQQAPSAPVAVPESQETGPLPAPLPASQAYSEQAPEPSPQLRVVQGGPDPVEFSKAHHPSQEQQPVQLAPAPDPAPVPQPPVQAQPTQPATQPEQKLSFRQRHAQEFEAGQRQVQQRQQASQAAVTPPEPEDFSPSEDDKPLESAVLIGQKAVEKILGGKVIDEQPLHQPV